MRSTAVPTEGSSCGSRACDLRIDELVHRDPVTGLANRAQLRVDLEQAWDEARARVPTPSAASLSRRSMTGLVIAAARSLVARIQPRAS